jgi:hypothetical protein
LKVDASDIYGIECIEQCLCAEIGTADEPEEAPPQPEKWVHLTPVPLKIGNCRVVHRRAVCIVASTSIVLRLISMPSKYLYIRL